MTLVGNGTRSDSIAGVLTKADLRSLVRSLVEERGGDWLANTTDTILYTIDKYIDLAYNKYAAETECFINVYDIDSVISEGVYSFNDISAGLFKVRFVAYDGLSLKAASQSILDNSRPNWRFADDGIPTAWVPWGGGIRLFPTPAAIKTITVECCEMPTILAETDAPLIPIGDHELLAIYAAIQVMIKDPSNENAIRASQLYPRWEAGIKAAKDRFNGSGQADIIVGRYARTSDAELQYDRDITIL